MSKVIGISGSLRKASFNTALIRACAELAPDGMSIELADISGIPLYDADVHEKGVPDAVQQLNERINASDGLILATPEYNRSMSGVIKNAVDWLSKTTPPPFSNRPVSVMGASPGGMGTMAANYQLRQVLSILNARVIPGGEVLVGQAGSKFDDDLKLTDEATRNFLAKHLEKMQYEIDLLG